jgi:hypothetical protein
VAPGAFIPAGAVFYGSGAEENQMTLDTISFRVGGAGTGLPRHGEVHLSAAELAQILPGFAD